MKRDNFFLNTVINSNITFDKEINTVYDLSYLLVDFQAIVNNFTEIFGETNHDSIVSIDEIDFRYNEKYFIKNKSDNKHPSWQKRIEEDIEDILFQEHKAVANYNSEKVSLKQTTSRNFNKRHRGDLQLIEFSKGSLVLDLVNSLLVSFVTEFLKELLIKQTGNEEIIKININPQNEYIVITDSTISVIPKNCCIQKAISIQEGTNTRRLNIKKCIHNVVEASNPNQNTEESVRRFIIELQKNGLIDECAIYDNRGIKTATRDIERFMGNFVDYRA